MASELIGTAALSKKLADLGAEVRGPALKSIARAGMKPALDRWRATIQVGDQAHRTYKGRLVAPGFSQRSTRVITKLSPDKQKGSAIMGVRAEAFYATWFIERMMGRGKEKARPSLRAAFEATQGAQLSAVAAKLQAIILKIAARQ